ncbi:hypothetical protein [Bacillus benzoevorans]|uniref:Uncharacterized protein n=1 Tax=Bacillus benzoevorans TaxID=1456 RepID=A0A7X0HTD9_9BACI|nr:hypothetical protein [Bacillus benzoevorans]MBB6446483.1 hypothetical protein [Bacillus benzoevorans]
MNDIEQLMEETAKHYEQKMAGLYQEKEQLARENGQLRNALRNRDKEIKGLNKQLQHKRKSDPQHYRNGRKRGSHGRFG